MTTREERIGRNEALFRQVNERLEDINRVFTDLGEGKIDGRIVVDFA